jgi:hypothetical protein
MADARHRLRPCTLGPARLTGAVQAIINPIKYSQAASQA